MSYRHTLEAAVESLHEIEGLIKGFPEDNKIPGIEIDLALQKLRNLYELLMLLRDNENFSPGISAEDKSSGQYLATTPEISEKQSSQAVIVVEESKKTTVAMSSTVEETKQPGNEVRTEFLHEQKEEKHERKMTSSKKSSIGVQTLADQFKGRPTLLETLSRTYNSESETIAHSTPISDLMSAIGINDRFTFIRELFNNDKKAFETAILTLNDAGSYNNANDYLMQQFNWDMDSEAVQLLLSILRRKYTRREHE
jgi:hypothetical protein